MTSWERLSQFRPKGAVKYAVGVASAIGSTGIQLVMWDWIAPHTYTFYYPGLIVASWLGGWSAGITATVCSAIAANYFFTVPYFSFYVSRLDLLQLFVFIVTGVLITFLNATLISREQVVMERERASRFQRDSDFRFRTLVDTSPAILWTTEKDGHCSYLSKQWYELTGQTAEAGIGFGWLEMTHSGDQEHAGKVFLEANSRQKQFSVVYRLRSKEGDYRWALDSGNPRFDENGEYLGMIGTVIDITEQVLIRQRLEKLTEELKEALRVRDEFLSIASHELKTPLTSLTLQAQMRGRRLDKGELSSFTLDQLKKMFDSDLKSLTRLNRLIEDMLNIARINTGRLELRKQCFDLCVHINEIVSRFRPHAEDARTSIHIESCSEAWVEGDSLRIEQVVTNILNNAVKYGLGKPIYVKVEIIDQSFVVAKVIDQGIGIAEKDQKRIFSRFERAVSANEVSGLGLGLSISRDIIEAHGGQILVESELGKGSIFSVQLPLTKKAHA